MKRLISIQCTVHEHIILAKQPPTLVIKIYCILFSLVFYLICRSIATYRHIISMGATDVHLEDEWRHVTKLDVDTSLAMMRDMQASWQSMRAQRW